jgi:hypothetical protein
MKKGEVCILRCGPLYAYGNANVGPIPANSTLNFEVELLDWSARDDSLGGKSQPFRFLIGLALLAFILYHVVTYYAGKHLK